MMPKRPILFALGASVLGLVFAGAVRYQLRHETVSLLVILFYGLFMSALCSLSLVVVVALEKKKKGWLYCIAGVALLLGLFFASLLVADRAFGTGGSKLIGPFPVLVLIPLFIVIFVPVVKKTKHA